MLFQSNSIHRTTEIKKNQALTLTVTSLNSEGQGVGRADGFVVFVPDAISGETVRAHIIKAGKNHAVAKLIEVLEPSPDRVTPRCPISSVCGGCTLQHMSYARQLVAKRQIVEDALTRLGGFAGVQVELTLPMTDPWRYRNKGSFPFDGTNLGLYAARSHRLIPIDDCPIQNERVMQIAKRVEPFAGLRHAVARTTEAGETMAVIVTAKTLSKAQEEKLKSSLPDVNSLYHNLNAKDTNVIFGPDFRLLQGKPTLQTQIGGLTFAVGPASFLQVNPKQTETLYAEALRLLAPKAGETVVDIYCGIGTLTLLAAKHAAQVIGIESVAAAVENARQNAILNSITNADFIAGNAEDILPKLVADGLRSDAILLDPPRKGCDPAVLHAIAACRPSRVAYISCNPATLARDLKLLCADGYTPAYVQPVDMFPHTAHIETVALLNFTK